MPACKQLKPTASTAYLTASPAAHQVAGSGHCFAKATANKESQDLGEHPIKHAANTHQTCGKYASNTRQICIKHAANTHQTCGKYASNMRQIRIKHAANTQSGGKGQLAPHNLCG
jgi:hypothetical protein